MKALLSTATGGPETLELGEVARPTPGKGQMVVDVKACAVNFPDVLIIEDKYQFKPQRPFAPGGWSMPPTPIRCPKGATLPKARRC